MSEEVDKYFTGFIASIDCTEQQQIPRPTDKNKRKMFYSGMKKRHTIKNQFRVNSDFIIHKVRHKKRVGGIMICIQKSFYDSKEVVNVFNLGFLEVEQDYLG